MKLGPITASLLIFETPQSVNKVAQGTSSPSTQQTSSFFVGKNTNNERQRFLGRLYQPRENTSSAALTTQPVSTRGASDMRSLRADLYSGQGREGAFELDLTQLNSRALQGLPPDLQRLKFDNNSHALSFIKAAVARDFDSARAIACSTNSDEQKRLSTDLRGLDEGSWRNGGRKFFKDRIDAFKVVAQHPVQPAEAPALSSFRLDLTKVPHPNFQTLPAGMRELTFENELHALCFMKAVAAGDYPAAANVHRSNNRSDRVRLVAGLQDRIAGRWRNKWSPMFKGTIAEQKSIAAQSPVQAGPGTSSFRLNLTQLNSRALQGLPQDLRHLTFDSTSHALSFMKAAVAGSRTGNYDAARHIISTHDSGDWRRLTENLQGFDRTQWQNGGRDFFKTQINTNRLFAQPSDMHRPMFNHVAARDAMAPAMQFAAFNARIPRNQDESFHDPYRDVPRLSETLSKVNTIVGAVTCFYEPETPFSNWHPSPFTDPVGIRYDCMEQYLFAQKFLRLGNFDAYREVMAAAGPQAQKKVNREHPLDRAQTAVWQNGLQDVVLREGSHLKYAQNPHLLDMLLLTEGPMLESAKKDPFYGTDAAVSDPQGMHAIRNCSWTGENKLGNTLTAIREEYRAALEHPMNAAYKQHIEGLRIQYKPAEF